MKDGTPCDDAAAEPKAAPVEAAAKPAADATKADPAKADDTKPADAPAKADDKNADDKSPPAPALPSDSPPAGAAAATKPPALNALPLPAPVAHYRELDDDLKEQIRDTVRTDKALVKMSAVADKALEMMMDLNLKHLSLEAKDRDKFAAKFPAELKAYAEEHGLEYKETAEMSQLEMMRSIDERIGNATDPVAANGASRNRASVAEPCEARSTARRNRSRSSSRRWTPARAVSRKASGKAR